MDRELNRTAPEAPSFVESAQQYYNSGIIANNLAEFIQGLGFEALSHIDGNYDVICPLVARDAGLGEIGRMGLLISPEHGPRLRIAVVTTNAAINEDERIRDLSVIDFCQKCKKCAHNCPVNAIPYDDLKEINHRLRWQIDQVKCYSYWRIIGNDCGRCMSVCPYSHPNNIFHKSIRKATKRSSIFTSLAIPLDDLFYGKKPKPLPVEKIKIS